MRIHALTVAVLSATSPDGSLGGVLKQALSRLNAISTDDPVALRDELVHFAHAQKRLGVENEAVLWVGNGLAIGYRTVGLIDYAIGLELRG